MNRWNNDLNIFHYFVNSFKYAKFREVYIGAILVPVAVPRVCM